MKKRMIFALTALVLLIALLPGAATQAGAAASFNICDGGVGCPSGKFIDVNIKDWYHPYVDYAVTRGLFNGTSKNTFDPEGTMTRAMLVTVLWRYEGKPEAGTNIFSDVPDNQWYAKAVSWAAANGVVNGVGDSRFDPEGKISREQIATILFRYAKRKGIDVSKRGDLKEFPDGAKVESWAKDAVQWAVKEKLIVGSDGKLLPQGNATRAQVATILMRLIENIIEPDNSNSGESGESGASNPGESGASNSGESGASNSGESGASNSGESGASNSGESGASNPGESGNSNSGDPSNPSNDGGFTFED